MRRGSDFYGLPVIDAKIDKKLGKVLEILVDIPERRLVALVLPGFGSEPELIPAERAELGRENILTSHHVLVRGEDAQGLRRGKLTLERVRKLTAYNRSGERLGNVEDLIMDGSRIEALELSDGLLQDIFEGRRTITTDCDLELTREKVIIPDGIHSRPLITKDDGHWCRDKGF